MITETQQGKKSRPELYEMLENIAKAKSRKDKIDLVKSYVGTYQAFADYLRCVFDPRINFLLPESRPPFDLAEEEHVPSTWHKQHMKLKYFVKGGPQIHELKRETMFIGMLESVHPRDAEFLVMMLAKKTVCKGLTESVIKEAAPQLLPS
jgi:hypothetical protein